MRNADNLPPSCAVVMKSGSLNFLEPSGPLQACNGTANNKKRYATSHAPHSNTLQWGGEPCRGRVPKLFINFEEILSRAHGNSEVHNKVWEPSIIIINYCIIINAHYNYNCIIIS